MKRFKFKLRTLVVAIALLALPMATCKHDKCRGYTDGDWISCGPLFVGVVRERTATFIVAGVYR